MERHPLVIRLMCVALVAALMLPVGEAIYPFLQAAVSAWEFSTFEAVFSATVGFLLYATVFG